MDVDGSVALSKRPWKQDWLDAAEVIDSLRIFPRILVTAYGWLVGYITIWWCLAPVSDHTVQDTTMLGGVYGLATYIIKIYLDGGRDWDKYRANTFTQNVSLRGASGAPAQ